MSNDDRVGVRGKDSANESVALPRKPVRVVSKQSVQNLTRDSRNGLAIEAFRFPVGVGPNDDNCDCTKGRRVRTRSTKAEERTNHRCASLGQLHPPEQQQALDRDRRQCEGLRGLRKG